MPCKDYLPLVEKLADGEATPAEKHEVEAHLSACEDCREHFRFLSALPAAARKMSPVEPPGIYWDVLPGKIMTRIAQLEEREKRSPRRRLFDLFSPSGLRWAGALAAAVVAAVVGLRILDVPFTGQPRSQDALQRPSASVGESAEGGKTDQPVVGNRLRFEEQPAGEASSERSFAEPQEDQPEGMEPRAAPSQPASQIVAAPSAAAPDVPPGPAGVEERDSLSRAEQFADGNEALQKTQAAGETGQVTVDEAESHEPEREGASREGGRFEAAARPQDARDQPPSPTTPTPSGLRASRTRPDQEAAGAMAQTNAPVVSTRSAEEDYRALLERYPLGSAVSADAVEEMATSNEEASNDKAKECADWRQFVDEHGGSEQETSARYRLALCSIALYELQSSDDNRRQAVTDGQSFLALEPSGDRANAIRRGLERIER